jgi:unsaturated rhamnogalacturonyl hydrolase
MRYFILLCLFVHTSVHAQNRNTDALKMAKGFAKTIMTTYPDSIVSKKFLQHMLQDKEGTDPGKRSALWNYEEAVTLKGIDRLWRKTGDDAYFTYMKKIIDHFIGEDGSIRTYLPLEYNSDQVTGGLILLTLYEKTKESKYKIAMDHLWEQIQWQPRTKEGGFWHKYKYPYQMWLDGAYMLDVFYASYTKAFQKNTFTDIANQLTWMNKHLKDPVTGLLFHGWDESKKQQWCDPVTGRSPEIWSRSMGWYVMALVDIIELFPSNHPKRPELIRILNSTIASIAGYQDKNSGVWYQIVNKGGMKGNYLEASGSTMFTYAMAKGIHKGYLPEKFKSSLKKAYEGLQKEFITIDEKGLPHIHHSCSGAGLGGTPYRSGTYDYYINEPQRSDDLKTIGPLISLFLLMGDKQLN